MNVEHFWAQISGNTLRQGDWLPHCVVPVFGADLNGTGIREVDADEYDVIILTQSCALEQHKVRLVAACPVYSLEEFESVNPAFAKKGRWNEVLKGRVEGIH